MSLREDEMHKQNAQHAEERIKTELEHMLEMAQKSAIPAIKNPVKYEVVEGVWAKRRARWQIKRHSAASSCE